MTSVKHSTPVAVAAVPTSFSNNSNNSASLKEITVIDPTSRYGKLTVPMNLTFETKGRTEWIKCNGRLKKDLSICCLFQKGKCHVGERCFQVHVDRNLVNDLRKKYANLTTCCHACGDVHSDNDAYRQVLKTQFPSTFIAISFGGPSNSVDVSCTRLANTIGLEDLLHHHSGVARRQDGTAILPFNKVCRLHLKNSCKYGRDCKNLHVCYKVAEQLNGHSSEAEAAGYIQRTDSMRSNESCRSGQVTPVPSTLSTETMTPTSAAAAGPKSLYNRVESDDSLCATPELNSRTSTPQMHSPVDSCVAAALSLTAIEPLAASSAAAPMMAQDLSFLTQFQSQWGGKASTESLQIIFSGFPPVL